MMTKKHVFLVSGLILILALALAGCGKSWSGKELDSEKSGVTLAREAERGGYKLVTTPELRAWIDQKKPMMIIDTMPLKDSYVKQHVPGAVPYEFPIPEVKEMDAAGKLVASICHGAWVLCSAGGMLKGRQATSFFAIKDDVINAGATWHDAEVVVDRNLVTSRQPEDLPAFCRASIRVLTGTRAGA